jgi:lysophospholipase L1-like esterase
MVNQMRRRFPAQVAADGSDHYTHVIVFGGVNDLYSDLTAHRTNEKIQSDLRQIYERARGAGAEVVAIGVAPWGGFTKYWNERRESNTIALNRWMAEQVGRSVDHYVDAHALLGCGSKLCPEYFAPFRDGIHFGPKAHEKLGRALHEKVFQNCL